ncbi:putative signal peptide protein [Rhodopirellula islandica]|uniref:Signal peptide protein n=2 Tax=Rhodopirellula islandica TaxID=595434 RepID=A0A0J1BGP6_RHOIS|nr:putative signal peptide protein [Rhodopirellula islandica]
MVKFTAPFQTIAIAVLLVALIPAAGCQFVPDRPSWTKKLFEKEVEAVVPTRMMVMWADTVLHQPQKPGVRGFGARIYFYNEEDPDPVKVDGGLAVYAFDADDLNPNSAKPKRKFVFTADQFAEHMSNTSMGISYSVWCPWDEVGGFNEQLSLIVRFEGRSGGVVISDSTVKLLPGLNRPIASPKLASEQAAGGTQAGSSTDLKSLTQLATFRRQAAEAATTQPPRRQTQTIDLPPSFYRHLTGPSESVDSMAIPAEQIPATPDSPSAATNESQLDDTTSTSTRNSYPFRTLGDEQLDAAPHGTRQHSIPAGWIPSLPKTPRYGYSRAARESASESLTPTRLPDAMEK